MKNLLTRKYFFDFLAIGLLLFLLPFFFFKLGQSSLVSWDEAWYAEIARNIIQSGDLFNLRWNDMAYYDHPPTGFWLIALGELIFGYSEFGVRVGSTIIGFLAVIVTYFLGKTMFNRVVGFSSALGLSSAFWFLFRSRSGNLDVFLTFFFLLSFLTAWKAKDDKRWLIPFGLSFVLLVLTKTGIPFTIIPALIIVFWGIKHKFKAYLPSLGIILVLGGVWVLSQYLTNMSFFDRYFQIGLPGVGGPQSSYADNFALAKTYLHDGIGKWFWPGVVGLAGSVLVGLWLVIKRQAERRWFIFPLFFACFFGPFILSAKGHIWHLIPLHPFMILSFFAASYWLWEKIVGYLDTKILRQKQVSQYLYLLVSLSLTLFAFYLSSTQLRSAWVQFIDQTRYISDEQILATEAGRVPGQFFIDDDFGPTAVWYSGKKVMQIRDDDVGRLFNKEGKFANAGQFVLITKQYRLDDQGIEKDRYKILKSDRDKILVQSL